LAFRSGLALSCGVYGLCLAGALRAEEPVTITVQGESRPQGELPNEPFVATSRVRRERLQGPALRAADVLRSEPGVQISESGGLGAPATASIRAATAAQTPVYLGGVRLNDQVGGVADLSTIPVWLIDHVDVYRGNAPLEADDLGIGGAIFFEPKQPRGTEAGAGTTLGSFGSRGGFAYLAGGPEQLQLLGGVSLERSENDYPFKDDRGTLFQPGDDAQQRRSNSDSRLVDAWLLGRARPSRHARVELLVNGVSREQGAPKLALVPSELARAELSRSLAALTARMLLGRARTQRLTLRASFMSSASSLDDPALELGLLGTQTRVQGSRGEQHASWSAPLMKRLNVGAAVDLAVDRLQRQDAQRQLSVDASSVRAAGKLSWQPIANFFVRALIASECRSLGQERDTCQSSEPVGRIGLGLSGPSYAVYANLSRYQRHPSLGELYGAGILVRGNAQLRPELGSSLDVGGRATARVLRRFLLRGELSGFVRSAHELVVYARTAQGYVVPQNVGAASVSGLELGLGADAFERLTADCNVTLVNARDTTPGRTLANDVLPFTSRLVLAPRLTLTSGHLGERSLTRADVSLDLTYLSNRFADAAGLISIPEQTTLGVSGSAQWLGGALLTRARLSNALNTARFDVVGYPLPGRSLYVSAEVHAP
jgi:vitamin B12 transporter